jgi:ParB/RepB/Spo0J family partition protein
MSKEKIYSEIIMVDPLKVNPNKYNPNLMTDNQFESLVADFEDNGWIGQPVVVNKKFEIIDGFHRWKASMKLGFEKIPVVVFQPESEEHQKIVTIALNSKRGEMNPLKLAGLISELNQKYTLDELSLKLGFGVADLKDKLALTQVTMEFMEKLKKDAEDREKEVPTVMNFAVSKEQEKTITEALASVQGKSKGEKLYSLCSAYLKEK